MQTKKVPVRMCSGCAEHFPKKELVRIVRNSEGEVFVDLTGKKAGRGAYICKNINCLNRAKKIKKLERSFAVPISDEIYERLERELTQDAE